MFWGFDNPILNSPCYILQMPDKGSNKIKQAQIVFFTSLKYTPQITAFSLFDLSVRFNPLTRNSIMKEKRKYKASFT